MATAGWMSVLPPVLSIGLALSTHRVYLSLGSFVWLGWTILSDWNPLRGLVRGGISFFDAVTQPGNAKTLVFSALIGAVITVTQASGGVEGFLRWAERRGGGVGRRRTSLWAVAISMSLFIESNFGLLVSGSVARPLADRARVSREKLAYLLDSTCAPKQLLIPLNAWGAYVVALLTAQGLAAPNEILLGSLPFNFYAIIAIGLAIGVAGTGWSIGPMKEAERRVAERAELLRPGAQPMVAPSVLAIAPDPATPQRAVNLVVPILTMVAVVPVVLWWSGAGRITAGSGSDAVLIGVFAGLATAALSYRAQRIMRLRAFMAHAVAGVRGLVPVVAVLSLAFAISITQRELGTGVWLARLAGGQLGPAVIPALVFLLSAVMAFSTGTSWGTFAIMIPIVVPMTGLIPVDLDITLAAALGGGVFGDHCSPISDSTIIASMACATDHIDHVRTQLPYALMAAAASLLLFLAVGWWWG